MICNLIFRCLGRLSRAFMTIWSTLFFRVGARKCGENIKVVFPAFINIKGCCEVGDDFYCGPNFYYSSNKFSSVTIGDGVMFGPFVRIISGNHILNSTQCHIRYVRDDDSGTKRIVIESGSWVSAGVTILSGAHIGEGAVVGCGAVVSAYIPPYVIAVGVPANKFRRRFSDEELGEMLSNISSSYSLRDVLSIYEKYKL